MSHRDCLYDRTTVGSTPRRVTLFRDFETQTYRLFIDHDCVDFTIEELTTFGEAVASALETHEPWIDYDALEDAG